MPRPALEVADIFRDHGPAWRQAHAGHVSLDQLKVMSAIEICRTAALGGHVARCEDCAYTSIAYNSCRNRHCPKCQGAAAKQWLADREAELLPVPYYHVVFTLPARIADIAYHNRAILYDLLFKVSAETMLTIAADPKHLGARIGITSVLHTWGSAMTHHPHVHMIVPGGGISPDSQRWVSCRSGFLLPVRVLSRLFRRLFLERLAALHQAGRLNFFGNDAHLGGAQSFAAFLASLRKTEWVVYAKRPFGGPEAVLAYLSRYTHRVAIANSRLIVCDQNGVTFRWKDYRVEGRDRQKRMTLATFEFIRRFLIHVLPKSFHRIRHYGLLARGACAENIARARDLLAIRDHEDKPSEPVADISKPPCPCCGGRMIVIEVFEEAQRPAINPPRQPAPSGSTPHDRASAILQNCSSRPPLADRPRQNAPRHFSVVANRPTFHRVRCHPPLIRRSRHRRAARCIGSDSIGQLACGGQITIAPAAPVFPTMRGFLVWGFFCQGVRQSGKSLVLRQFLCSISKPVSSSRPAVR